MTKIEELIKKKVLVIDGAMGTQIQSLDIPESAWEGKQGCNELLNSTYSKAISNIHKAYLQAGADIIKTNSFGSIPWVLDDYDIGDKAYELSYKSAKIVKKACNEYSTEDKHRFCAGTLGPGTKLPSLGHISYDEMYEGYKTSAKGLIDGGCDLFLLETCQDPLQIKAALHACFDAQTENIHHSPLTTHHLPLTTYHSPLTTHHSPLTIPIMVSVTIELSGTMLIGTDTSTIATIMEPFDIMSLGFNCGTGPEQVKKHIKRLSEVWHKPISVHANAGLPQNRGGCTFYPMEPEQFASLQFEFLEFDGVTVLGGCCGTTPEHIKALCDAIKDKTSKKPVGSHPKSLASLFETRELIQKPAPFLMGERSNATGSKAFRELLIAEDYEGTLSVAQQQVRSGAHGVDISVGFAGRDESKDMDIVSSLYAQKISLPLMIDSTQAKAIEAGLKRIGGKPIINSVNLEDGIEKFDGVCYLSKRYGTSLVCLVIDEKGMAKTKERKIEIAQRIYKRATNIHGIDPRDLVFDLLTFTVGSGDEEYFDSAIQTIEAIREFHSLHPEVSFVLGVSNISFGLAKHAREYLNSVFLHHCVEAGLSMAIVNVKNTLPIHKISEKDIKICEDLLFNERADGDPLAKFINHFEEAKDISQEKEDEEWEAFSTTEKIHKVLIDGDKQRIESLLEHAKDEIKPEKIINDILIGAMKEVGELFGDGKMQLPFVLQSAETMKFAVDFLQPYLPKKENQKSKTTLVLGTVKGDVHDVGKNLVDIILSNNGFKVVNIGIKSDIEDFTKAIKEHNADAVGMSGLLVKSTAVMKENLEELKKADIDLPVLLGGAALTKKFIDEFCRPIYDGPIFYCKDAFDGIVAMGKVEMGDLQKDISLSKEQNVAMDKPQESISSIAIPSKQIQMPDRDIKIPVPPFWGRRSLDIDLKELAFEWIDHKFLFSKTWGYSSRGMTQEEKQKQKDDVLWALFEQIKEEILKNDVFKPVVLYGYYPCRSDENSLLVFDESEGWFNDADVNREPLSETITRAKYHFEFPRQKKEPFRALSDFFHRDRDDVVAFTCVSAGSGFSEYEKKIYESGDYKRYHLIHGMGVSLAEALAEIVHKQIRLELNFVEGEGNSLRDVKTRAYKSKRYSFGYDVCPDLSMNKSLFKMLRPEEFGITLSQTYQMHPEQTTSAIVVHHPNAFYFSI